MALLWAFWAVVWAAVGPELSGSWRLTDSPQQVEQFKREAVERTLNSMNFAIRMVAGSRVESAVTACAGYALSVDAAAMRVRCDSKPEMVIYFNGASSTYTDAGHTYTVTGSVQGDVVKARLKGDDAQMDVVYDFSGGQLKMQKTIHSEYFGEPLRWTNSYRR